MYLRHIISIGLLFLSLVGSGVAWGVVAANTGMLRLDTSDPGLLPALSSLHATPHSELLFTLRSPADDLVPLNLRPYEPFANSLRVFLDEEQLDAGSYNGQKQYYRGHVEGELDSFAFLAIGPDGDADLRYELDDQEHRVQIRSGDLQFVTAQLPLKRSLPQNPFLNDVAIDNNEKLDIPDPAVQRTLHSFAPLQKAAGAEVIVVGTEWSDVYLLEVPAGQSAVGVLSKGPGLAGVVIMKDLDPRFNFASSSCASGGTLPETCVISAPPAGTYYIAVYKFDSDDVTLSFNHAEALSVDQYLQATVAIDTDSGFYNYFGDPLAALDYFASLFAYASNIYESEINTQLVIGDVYLSTPYTATSSSATRLDEVKTHWKQSRSTVTRTLVAHFSSQSFGGRAVLDGLCSSRNGYSVSGVDGIEPIEGGPIAWDANVLSHEIGHTFSSPHTHCYAGIGGNADPVDACWWQEASCWSGATSLPGENSLTGGSSGSRNGTIMSYCHQQAGGVTNIAGTFGASHPFGVAPSRVSNKMSQRAFEIAAIDQECITIESLVPMIPSTPVITNIEPGNAQVSVSVSVADDGGSPITGYTAICAGSTGYHLGTSPTSPITVSGLNNGVSYVCLATATNAVGTSPSSELSAPVTPVASAPGC